MSIDLSLITPLVLLLLSHSLAQRIIAPESVDYHYPSQTRYISNTINILETDVRGETSIFTSEVSHPYGIEVVGDELFVIDGSVKVFNLNTGVLSRTIEIPEVGFLNGIHYDQSQFVYVSDFVKSNIWKIDTYTYSPSFVADVGPNPNGVYFDTLKQRLYVVTYADKASIYEVDEQISGVIQVASTDESDFDGITQGCDGNYYVSAWGSQSLLMFDNQFSNPPEIVLDGLNHPSDLFYHKEKNQVVIPNSGNHTLNYYDLHCESTSWVHSKKVDHTIKISLISHFLKVKGHPVNSTLNVYAIDGQLSVRKKLSRQSNVDISQLPSGTYIAQLIQDKNKELTALMFRYDSNRN